LVGQYWNFIRAGQQAYRGAAVYAYDGVGNTAQLGNLAAAADTVIFCLENREDLRLIESLRYLNKRVVVFCLSSSLFQDNIGWVDSAAALYSTSDKSFIAGFSVLLGRINGGVALP
jgi:hypothetical protein